jgi:lipoprotein-releasing system ATP-binding protein
MIVKAKNIHKRYDHLHVLKGIDLEVKESEVITIIGKSGAGKSTLLHILGTLDPADEGQLEICGQEIANLNHKQLARFRNEKIGFIFQFHHLLNEFTAVENVAIPAFIGGKPKDEGIKRAKELLDYLGLNERFSHKPTELSGGEQQRVAVARALMNKPEILFADEPSGNLDSETSSELHELIFKLRADFGHSFVIVTHNQVLSEMSDRILFMKDGRWSDNTFS